MTLPESLHADRTGYVPVAPVSNDVSHRSAPVVSAAPGQSIYMRCPLPTFWSTSSDSQRTFYAGHVVPQTRIYSPPIL